MPNHRQHTECPWACCDVGPTPVDVLSCVDSLWGEGRRVLVTLEPCLQCVGLGSNDNTCEGHDADWLLSQQSMCIRPAALIWHCRKGGKILWGHRGMAGPRDQCITKRKTVTVDATGAPKSSEDEDEWILTCHESSVVTLLLQIQQCHGNMILCPSLPARLLCYELCNIESWVNGH